MCERGVLPVVPKQGSVGASGDLAPLAHMTAVMLGVGEAFVDGERMPADAALARAGLQPLALGPKEGLALLNGTQFSTADALAALFAIERVFQAALVTGALATDAAKAPTRRSIRASTRCAAIAARSRSPTRCARLMAGSRIRASHLTNDDRVQDPYCLRCQPQVMGAVLDLMRHVAATLEIEANGVSDNPLIFADTRRGAVRRQLPCRAGRASRPTCWRSPSARSARSPSGASPCWSIPRSPACRRSSRQARAQFRLHDRRR